MSKTKNVMALFVAATFIVTPLADVSAARRSERESREVMPQIQSETESQRSGRKWLNAKKQPWWDDRFEGGIRQLLDLNDRVRVRVRVKQSTLDELLTTPVCDGPGCAAPIAVKIKVRGKKYNGFVWKSWDDTGGVRITIDGEEVLYTFPSTEPIAVIGGIFAP